MHPYEMSTTLRERRKEDSIRLNFGSLYAVVESLAKRGWIEALETVQTGRRPARTTYGITETGVRELAEWMGDLLSRPTPQFTDFEAALSLIATLPVDEVRDLLQRRLRELKLAETTYEAMRAAVPQGFPRLFLVEAEYQQAVRGAEIGFVTQLLDDIDHDNFSGLQLWRRMHELRDDGSTPEEIQAIIAAEFSEELSWMTE